MPCGQWTALPHIFESPRNDTSGLAPASKPTGGYPSASRQLKTLRSSADTRRRNEQGRRCSRPAASACCRTGRSANRQMLHPAPEARSAFAGRGIRRRPYGAAGAVHRRRARPRGRPIHAAPISRCREGAAADLGPVDGGFAGKEGSGRKAWQSGQLDRRAAAWRAVQAHAAGEFATAMLPMLKRVQRTGATTLAEIADALNARGVCSATGGRWHRSAVRNLLAPV